MKNFIQKTAKGLANNRGGYSQMIFAQGCKFSAILLLFLTFGITQVWGQTLIEADDMETSSGTGTSMTVSGWSRGDCDSIARSSEARTGSYSMKTCWNNTGEKTLKTTNTSISLAAKEYLHCIGWAKLESSDESTTPNNNIMTRATCYINGNSNGDTIKLNNSTWRRFKIGKCKTSAQEGCYMILKRKHEKKKNILYDDIVIYKSMNSTTDIVAPTAASSASATSSRISWTCGSDANTGIANTLIWKRTSGSSDDLTLNDQGKYAASATDQSGHWTCLSATVGASATYFDDTFEEGRYAIVHRDLAYNYSTPTYVTVAPACSAPDAPTISSAESQTEFTEGETITLTASCASGADESTTYTWYKGESWATASAASPVQTAAVAGSNGHIYTTTAATSDAGIYWCEASNGTGCKSHNSTGFEISVNEAVKAYTVTPATNDEDWGTAEAGASTADEDDEVTITATAEEGYKFVSWSVSGEGSTLSSTTTNPTTLTVGTENVTVTATFRALYTYTISYNAGSLEGTIGSKDSESKTEDAAFTLPSSAVFSCDGYTQNGWNTNTDGASGTPYALGGSYTTNAAQTFYPEWKVNAPTISFNGSTNIVTITVPGGSTVRYTTDGTDPTTTTGTVYSEAFVLDETSTVKAIAYQSGFTTSEIASKVCPVCVEPDEYTNEIARFFVPCGLSNAGDSKSKWNVTNRESSTGANTFTTSEFGGSSSNWSTNATTGLIYGKFSSNDTYVSLKLKSGNFKAGDIVYAYVNSSGNNLKFSKSSNTFGSATASGVTGEYVRSATLVAGDIEDDGSIKIIRDAGVSVNRIIVVRNGHAITKSETNGTIATTNSSSVAISAAKADETVYIAATPNTGYSFTSWSVVGDDSEDEVDVTESAGVYSFTMPDEPVTVTATFTAINYTITHSAASGGSYTIQVGEASAVSTNTTANYGQTITLAATPNSGYLFDHWTVTDADEGSVTVTNNTFTMPAKNVTVSATFTKIPNIYYYKDETRYTGSAYKNPEGGAPAGTAGKSDNNALTTPWTICSGCVTGVSVVATGAIYDNKGNHMNAYIKIRTNEPGKIVFTIASGLKATIRIKMGGYSGANTNITMKLNDTGDNIAYSGTMSGAATTENNYAQLTYSNLAAGAYTLKSTSGSLYISEIDVQTEYVPVTVDADSWAAAFGENPPTLNDVVEFDGGEAETPITITIAEGETAEAKSISLNNAKLNIAAGGALILADGITGASAESLTLGSSLENGNATLIYDVTTGLNATVQMASKATTTGGSWTWQYVGVPVAGVAENLYSNGYMYKWNNGWSAVAAKDDLVPFAGYCVSYDGAGHVFEMGGALTTTTSKTINVAAETAQVIGNSWTAPIQITQMDASDFNQVEQTIYLFNTGSDVDGSGSEANSSDRYAPGTYQVLPIASVKSGAIDYTTSISALQGFFVKNNTESAGSVTLNYAKHVRPVGENSVVNGPMHAPKRAAKELQATVARLTVSGSRYDDQVILIENDECSRGFDNGWDGEKIGSSNVSPWIYALREDGTHDAVSATNDMEGTVLGFRKGEDSQYTMSFDYNGEDMWYLNDVKAEQATLIDDANTYTFTATENDAARFIISQTPIYNVPTGIENGANDEDGVRVRKQVIDGTLYIIKDGKIFNAQGAAVK